ncbi:MAG: hypothetical protein JNL98_23115 [Bryobacterales bacterium]|nr:hypothetical protein [Bryobacterales bacterium]
MNRLGDEDENRGKLEQAVILSLFNSQGWGEGHLPEPTGRFSVRKLGCLGILAAIAVWIVAGWLGSIFRVTVAEGQRSYPYGLNTSFGYFVEKYRWRTEGFRVTLWAGDSLKMVFDIPDLELTRVKTQRWLARDRAVLIELDCIYHDSIDSSGELALLYDFERGELHSLGGAWSVWPPDHAESRSATKEEFYEIVARLNAPATPGVR